jgi:hypothetical protein
MREVEAKEGKKEEEMGCWGEGEENSLIHRPEAMHPAATAAAADTVRQANKQGTRLVG